MKHYRYQQQRMRKKLRFWYILRGGCLVAILCLSIALGHTINTTYRLRTEEESASTVFSQIDQPDNNAYVPEDASPAITSSPEIFDKAAKLLMQNSDLVGIVGFGNTALYVCQSDDNYHYASHRFDGTEDPAGMIFMDYRCSIWPLSDNIVLYGHNMRDGSRFGKLNRFTDYDYVIQHPIIRFASLYEVHDYRPIAVFYTSVDKGSPEYINFSQIDFNTESEFDMYIEAITEHSIVPLDTNVSFSDHLLTLATCSYEYDGGRLVIVCAEQHS